ncbi:hypothetical protein [Motilimonas sp. KMU-193]
MPISSRNLPRYLPCIAAQTIADIKGQPLAELIANTTRTSRAFFAL